MFGWRVLPAVVNDGCVVVGVEGITELIKPLAEEEREDRGDLLVPGLDSDGPLPVVLYTY